MSLVLKRYSMIGDGLSHVGFGALAIASALGLAPLAVAVPVVVLAAVLLLRLSQNSKIKGDAAIAMISSSALAIGVVVISVTTGMNTEVSSYMFGSVLSLSRSDAVLSVILSIAVLLAFTLLYPRIFAVTFDETFSRATGVRTDAYNTLIAVLTAVTVVLGMRMMGALAHLQPDNLPCPVRDARVQKLPRSRAVLGSDIRCALHSRRAGLVFLGDADRRKHRYRRSDMLRPVLCSAKNN